MTISKLTLEINFEVLFEKIQKVTDSLNTYNITPAETTDIIINSGTIQSLEALVKYYTALKQFCSHSTLIKIASTHCSHIRIIGLYSFSWHFLTLGCNEEFIGRLFSARISKKRFKDIINYTQKLAHILTNKKLAFTSSLPIDELKPLILLFKSIQQAIYSITIDQTNDAAKKMNAITQLMYKHFCKKKLRKSTLATATGQKKKKQMLQPSYR